MRNQPERNEAIKVRVIGSGSFGDPASLYIRTSDHSKWAKTMICLKQTMKPNLIEIDFENVHFFQGSI